jgi:hypothetical protein
MAEVDAPMNSPAFSTDTVRDDEEEVDLPGEVAARHNVSLHPTGASKACKCKKSKCLKLYCECFASNVFCRGCQCNDCHNIPEHAEERLKAVEYKLSRRPKAFEAKFQLSPKDDIKTEGSQTEAPPTASTESPLAVVKPDPDATPATPIEDTRSHTMGCHCKKSGCQKKYCECFQNGVSCTDKCRCKECKNDGVKAQDSQQYTMEDWMRDIAPGESPSMTFYTGALSGVPLRKSWPADFVPGLTPSFDFTVYKAPDPLKVVETPEKRKKSSSKRRAPKRRAARDEAEAKVMPKTKKGKKSRAASNADLDRETMAFFGMAEGTPAPADLEMGSVLFDDLMDEAASTQCGHLAPSCLSFDSHELMGKASGMNVDGWGLQDLPDLDASPLEFI